MVVVFVRGPIHPVLGRLNEVFSRASIHDTPLGIIVSILSLVADLVVGNLLGSDHANPWAGGEPAHIVAVAGSLGIAGEVAHVAPKDGDLILHATARAAGEELAHGEARASVARLVEVFGGGVVNREDIHAVDPVDAVTRGAKGGGAAEPFYEMPHLVGKGMRVTHSSDHTERLVVQDALAGPVDLARGAAIAVSGVQEFFSKCLVGVVELLQKIFWHMVGERGSEQIDATLGDKLGDACVECRAVGGIVRTRCPLKRGGECGSEVERERSVVLLVSFEEAVVAGGRCAAADEIVNDRARLNGLVCVRHKHHLCGFVAVVGGGAAKPGSQLGIQSHIVGVAPVIGCHPVIGHRVADVVAAGEVARACASRVRLCGEDLEIQRIWIAQPSGVLELLALDADLERIVCGGPSRFVASTKTTRLHTTRRQWILTLCARVLSGVAVHKNRAEILTVNRHDGLPAHVGGDINLIGHRALAGADIPRVDDDVGIDFAFPCLVCQVEEVDTEVDAAVSAGRDIATITEGKCNDIA